MSLCGLRNVSHSSLSLANTKSGPGTAASVLMRSLTRESSGCPGCSQSPRTAARSVSGTTEWNECLTVLSASAWWFSGWQFVNYNVLEKWSVPLNLSLLILTVTLGDRHYHHRTDEKNRLREGNRLLSGHTERKCAQSRIFRSKVLSTRPCCPLWDPDSWSGKTHLPDSVSLWTTSPHTVRSPQAAWVYC